MSNDCPKLKILDSTLREGHQSIHPKYLDRGIVFTREQQLEIAKSLIDFGVDYIEILTPVRSEYSLETAQELVDLAKDTNTKIVSHCRCTNEDIEASLKAGVHGINLFLNSSAYSKFTFQDTTNLVNDALDLIESENNSIEKRFSFEDAFRTDTKSILKAINDLADRLDRAGLPDTTGTTLPENVTSLIGSIVNQHPKLAIECHFHNDIDFATYNSIAALQAGATVISTTILGLGERTGIVSLSSLLAAFSRLPGGKTYLEKKYKLNKLSYLSEMIASFLNINIPINEPVVSKSAFSHVSGVHASSHLRDPRSYHSLSAELFGLKGGNICWASSVVGASSILYRANSLGVEISKTDAREIATIVREKAKKNGGITPSEVDKIIIKHSKETE